MGGREALMNQRPAFPPLLEYPDQESGPGRAGFYAGLTSNRLPGLLLQYCDVFRLPIVVEVLPDLGDQGHLFVFLFITRCTVPAPTLEQGRRPCVRRRGEPFGLAHTASRQEKMDIL